MQQLELKIPPLVQVMVIAGLMGLSASITREFLLPMAVRVFGGGLLLGVGLFAVLAGAWSFRRARTTLNPMQPHTATALVTGGIYRYSRNPMYAGFLLCLCGWACYLGNPYAFIGPAVFVVYMNQFQIKPEERTLQKVFGQEYDAYKRLVRRWL